ncbi:MAG: ATP-binding protein [Candidatus Asgardarchaeia archaeon]
MSSSYDTLVAYLKRVNYWWESKSVLDVDRGILREEYLNQIFKYLKLDRIICLTGIRRSGKTTLLYQIVDKLIREGIEPTRIVYLKMDDIIDFFNDLKELENVYMEMFGVDIKDNQVYFLIDEIHVLKNWQRQLKYFIDFKYKSKFIVSGSSRTHLFKDSSESLVGRIVFINVFPLTFREFLRFYNLELPIQLIDLRNIDFNALKKVYLQLIDKKSIIKNRLNEYIVVGGFPEWFKIKDKILWYRLLVDDYFTLMLAKDIFLIFNPKDPILLSKLAREIARLTAERFSYSGLANKFDAHKDTIKQYIHYLISSMLVVIAEKYTKRRLSQERSPKKIYLWEEGLRRAITIDYTIGRSAENIVTWHLIKLGMLLDPTFTPFYWKNKYEVDFVFAITPDIIPIEVKYKENVTSIPKGILEFHKKVMPVSKAIVVTKDTFDYKEEPFKIFFVPLWLFLLVLG